MKIIIFLLTMGFCSLALAQTNAPAVKAKPHPPTQITSDAADFDLALHQATYRGHVLVEDPEVKLTCDWLVVDLPSTGGHLSHVLADTNVVVDFTDKGQTYHVTSARAVYDYKVANAVTNETVTFSGSPKVVTATTLIESEPMVWDRTLNRFTFFKPKMISKEGLGGNNSTNAPGLKLF